MTYRTISDHIVCERGHNLTVKVLDEPGDGGANHAYRIEGFDTAQNQSIGDDEQPITEIDLVFQHGPIYEAGQNGITDEALLAILIDRMRGFQKGPFACRPNALAVTHLEEALMWLQRRTRDRIARGVEGKSRA